MCWLILTKNSEKDFTEWSTKRYRNCSLLIIDKDGKVHPEETDNYPNSIEGDPAIIIINYYKFPKNINKENELKNLLLALKNYYQKTPPRIWVHFGGVNSEDFNGDTIADRWHAKNEYIGLRVIFEDSMVLPYSRNISVKCEWDRIISNDLTTVVNSAITNRINLKIEECKELLEGAWKKASDYEGYKDLMKKLQHRRHLATRKVQELLPAFIYFDSLAFMKENKKSGNKKIKELIIREVPNIFSIPNKEEIEKIISSALSTSERDAVKKKTDSLWKKPRTSDDLPSMATDFCDWYKQFVQLVMQSLIEQDPSDLATEKWSLS
jgi:hypothetical protein